jgi:hypothetical protein
MPEVTNASLSKREWGIFVFVMQNERGPKSGWCLNFEMGFQSHFRKHVAGAKKCPALKRI